MKDYSTGLYFKNEEELKRALKILSEQHQIDATPKDTYLSLCLCEAKYLIDNEYNDTVLADEDGNQVTNIDDYVASLYNSFFDSENLIDYEYRDHLFSEWLKENNLKLIEDNDGKIER